MCKCIFLLWPQVYKFKHLGMQTAFTNICERMGHSQELIEFQHGTVIGCHLCNKSSREISLLLNIPQSTVSGIITKWKRLGTTTTQPQSGRPRKMASVNDRAGSPDAEEHSGQRSPTFCRVNRYRPPNFMWPSD